MRSLIVLHIPVIRQTLFVRVVQRPPLYPIDKPQHELFFRLRESLHSLAWATSMQGNVVIDVNSRKDIEPVRKT